jgi:hypothetical protein
VRKDHQHGHRRTSVTMDLNSEVLLRTDGVDIRLSVSGHREENSALRVRDDI